VTRKDPDDPLVVAYRVWMETVQHTPHNTVKARLRALRTLPHPSTATREEVEAWWESRAGLSPSTRQGDLAHLRGFYRWARIWEHRDDDPTIRLTSPKVPQRLPHPATRSEVAHLMKVLDGDMRRAVALGAYAGCRVEEAALADWADADMETRRLLIHGKGQKDRLVALGAPLYDAIGPHRPAGNIVTAGAHVYTANTLQRQVNRAIKDAGVTGTFHWLRHRAGTVALAATGGNLLAVARFLGHASVTTTAGYAATSDEDLDVIAEALGV